MGALPATLFLLSVWHFQWTRPQFSLHSSLLTMTIILLCLYHSCTHIQFALLSASYLFLSVLNMYTRPPHLFIILLSIVVMVFSKGENRYLFTQGNDSFFLALPFYLFILVEWLSSSRHPLFPLCLCVPFSHLPPSICFLFGSFPLYSYVWHKSSLGATLPLSCEDQWWH